MSKRGNETPRKSRRLNDEARSEEFHAPSLNILSQTQSSSAKDKSRTEKSKMKKKTNSQRKSRREKGKKSKP